MPTAPKKTAPSAPAPVAPVEAAVSNGLSDSTKRALRTAIEAVIACAAAAPAVAAHLPNTAVAAEIVAVAAAVTKGWAFAESKGWVPAWLR